MAKLFVTLSREEAENIAPVESTPMKGSEASDVIENAQDVAEETQQVEEMMASIEEAEDALDDLQEAENMAAASAGEEPVDVVTGEPVAGAEESECCDETPGVTEPTPTGTEEAVAAPAPEVAAAVATECLRQVKKRLGMDSEGIQVSFESLDSRSPISSLQLAREGIGDAAKKIWEAIKNMFKKIWDKIKELWGKFTGLFKKKAEVVEQIVEEAKEVEKELVAEGIKLSASDFTDEEKTNIAKACAICIGKNNNALENLELASRKIAATANAIKACAGALHNIPGNADKKAINEIVRETLDKVRSSFSIDMSLNGGSTDTAFNKTDAYIVTNIFGGNIIYAKKTDMTKAQAALSKMKGTPGEVVSHDAGTATVDGFNTTAAISALAATVRPLDSKDFVNLGNIVKTAAIKDFPNTVTSNQQLSKAAEVAIADLERMYNGKMKHDKIEGDKVKFNESGSGIESKGMNFSAEVQKNSVKLGGFINKVCGGMGAETSKEVGSFLSAIELWLKTTVTAGKRKKTPKAK